VSAYRQPYLRANASQSQPAPRRSRRALDRAARGKSPLFQALGVTHGIAHPGAFVVDLTVIALPRPGLRPHLMSVPHVLVCF
jgi:hypothetical protein